MAARKSALGNTSDAPGPGTTHGLDEAADSSRRELSSILGTGVGALALTACTTDVEEERGSVERMATTQHSFTLTDINAAIANAGAGGVAALQPGTYNTTSEILLENSTSLVCSGGRAKIVWDGGLSQASMLVIRNSTHSEVRNLDFDVGTGSKPLAAIKPLDGANHSITFRSVSRWARNRCER